MSQIPNNVRELLAKTNDRIAKARADQGGGALGPWPMEPVIEGKAGKVGVEHLADVTMDIQWDAKFRWKDKKTNAQFEREAFRVQFKYNGIAKYVNGTPEPYPEGDFPFDGNPMVIPYDITGIPDRVGTGRGDDAGHLWRVQRDEGRLKGCFKGLLNVDVTDTLAAITEAIKVFETSKAKNTTVQARVYLEFSKRTNAQTNESQTDKHDYIRELLGR